MTTARRGTQLLALAGVLFTALSLRTPVAALSPIIDRVGADIALDPVVIGIIGSAPPLAFAGSALLAPHLARLLGLERALVLAIAAMALGHLGRAIAPEAGVLTASSVVALMGVGVGNVLLPPLVRRYFPRRIGAVTAAYVTLLSVSTAVPALVAVPVADSAGWRVSLAMWVAVAVLAALPWLPLLRDRARPAPPPEQPAEPHTGPIELGAIEVEEAQSAVTGSIALAAGAHPTPMRSLLRSRTAWAIGVVFGSSSLGAYAFFAWAPSLLVDRAGVDAATGGALLALYAFMGFPAGLLIPVIVARFPRSTPWLVLLGAAFFAVGYLGLLLAPTQAPAVWIASAGLGPLLFPLALVLINLRAGTPATTVALSGFVQTVGYLLGAVGPFVVGVLHTASGAWTIPIVFLLAMVALTIPAGLVLARGRTVDDEIRRPD